MKKIIWLLIWIFKSQFIFSQSENINPIHLYEDSITSELNVLLFKDGADYTFSYFTAINNQGVTYHVGVSSLTFKIYKITKDSILYCETKPFLFMNYDSLQALAVKKEENKLIFSPPLTYDSNCASIIFTDQLTRFLIQGGSCEYSLNENLTEARLEVINLVQSEISLVSHWTFQKKYKRAY